MESRQEDRPLLGFALRLIAVGILSTMFMLVKLTGEYGVSVPEIVFYRMFIGAIVIGGWIIFSRGLASLKTKRLRLHLLRALVGATSMCCNFAAVTILPLAESSVLMFTVPLIATILSVLVLSEQVGWRRGSAVALGFVGVLIATQPGQSELPIHGILIGLMGAAAGAYVMILIRQLSSTEPSSTIVFYFMTFSVPILAIGMAFFATWHPPEVYGLLLLVAIVGIVGLLFMTESMRYAPVSKLMPMDYFNLFIATAYGFFIWDKLPSLMFWPGALLIVASGFYVAMRGEKKRQG